VAHETNARDSELWEEWTRQGIESEIGVKPTLAKKRCCALKKWWGQSSLQSTVYEGRSNCCV